MTTPWQYRDACASIDTQAAEAARRRQDQLTKPPGSLGRLEHLAVKLAAMQSSERPSVQRVYISVFGADHGVAAEGVSAFPQAVTGEMLRNFATGGAAISVLAREQRARLDVVNLGVVNDPGKVRGIRRQIIAPSTANFCETAAMTPTQLARALQTGARSLDRAAARRTELFIGGEMGIGNTTSASALSSALLGQPPSELVGAGTGVDAAGISRKTDAIRRALALHAGDHAPEEWLRRLGGFEIAALVGAYIAAAQRGIPMLIDGFITTVAALAAVRIQPDSREWMLFSHRSHESGHVRVLTALNADPLIDLGLRLGEASGAAVALPLLRLACALHNGMATFSQAGVSDS